ncbi:Thoeris anti-defense Tad2 family protein [Akkermansia muciniphila]|uniref:Thoeris anti-defense Tad2 family protein n=1 Tax=Akkermansia muciniphila TaxID=239935 RepID=UPI003CCEA0AB
MFERNPNQGRSFSDALHALKSGKGARLEGWAPDVVIRAQFPDEHSKMNAPYLYMESPFGRVPWKETFIELFSEEWEIVD